MAGRRLQLRVSLCCVIVVREARGSREIFVEQTWDAQNLALSSSGAICAETTPTPCHSGATSISSGICLLPAEKQPILRATLPRFGMTIPLGILKLHHYTFSVVQPGRRRGQTLDQSIRLDLRA